MTNTYSVTPTPIVSGERYTHAARRFGVSLNPFALAEALVKNLGLVVDIGYSEGLGHFIELHLSHKGDLDVFEVVEALESSVFSVCDEGSSPVRVGRSYVWRRRARWSGAEAGDRVSE